MIDIHCHILPGVDDGAKTIEDSLAMAKLASEQGIHTIIATPHHNNGTYENSKQEILRKVKKLNEQLQSADIDVTILPGQEPRINGEMSDDLEEDILLPLNETSGYLFVELPFDHIPRYTYELLFDLQIKGFTPILVHPERNAEIMERPEALYRFVKNGALTQLTASAVCGKLGKKIQTLSEQLIEANLVHFISSDAHNTTSRPFYLREAYDEIESKYGSALSYFFMENCELLISGETVIGDIPKHIKRKKILGLF
ncbi:tyrosine-protein phosphatase [Radiobacillus sp. PE A8.2]|uniref:tyrosine-protein phosphatase n=1 Tax=Radiobacillus sp. PE A8.2 TaxID=3380349 RepID=UPI00388D2718